MAVNGIALTAGMRANVLQLQKTADLFDRTQNRLATGKQVNTALDDPVKFFAALGHTSRANALSGFKSDMLEGVQTIKAADNGITGLTQMINTAKGLLQAMRSADSRGKTNLSHQFVEVFRQMASLATDSKYKGINLLAGNKLDIQFNENVDGLTVGGTGFTIAISANTVDAATLNNITLGALSVTGLSIAFIAGVSDKAMGLTSIGTLINMLTKAVNALQSRAAELSANLSIVTTRLEFSTNMINVLQQGSDQLTLADMNEEGANMLMLQTRQSLSTTALSLASQAAQSVLRLF